MKLASSLFSSCARVRRATFLTICVGLVAAVSAVWAKPVPDNLGYGLDKLIESDLAIKAGLEKGAQLYNGYATEVAAVTAEAAISSGDGRFLIDITLTGRVPVDKLQGSLERAFPSFEVTAIDPKYRDVGIIEGWIAVEEAAALAQTPGVRAVFLALKPHTNGSIQKGNAAATGGEDAAAPAVPNFAMLGTKFLQGVIQHRVDKINQFYNPAAPVNYDGTGITVGVMSDSFNKRTTNTDTNPNYATNLANFDQPGAAGNPVNTTEVVILEDYRQRGATKGAA